MQNDTYRSLGRQHRESIHIFLNGPGDFDTVTTTQQFEYSIFVPDKLE